MRRMFDDTTKVKVLVNADLEELELEIEEFEKGKIVIQSIYYGFVEDPRRHRVVIIYKDDQDFIEYDDDEFIEYDDDCIHVDGYGVHLYLDPDDLI